MISFPRSENPNGLEVYLHTFQLLTTVDEGIQSFGKNQHCHTCPIKSKIQLKLRHLAVNLFFFLSQPPLMEQANRFGTLSVTWCVRTSANPMIFQSSYTSRRALWFRHLLCCRLFSDAKTTGAATVRKVCAISGSCVALSVSGISEYHNV